MKKGLRSILTLVLLVLVLGASASEANADETKAGWYYETVEEAGRTGWRYYSEGELKILSWMYNKDTSTWNYLDVDGIMAIGWGDGYAEGCYFDENGVMVTGWHYLLAPPKQVDGSTVSATANVAEVKTPLQAAENSAWYFFESNGTMAVGWEKIDDVWYYFSDGTMENYGRGQMVTGMVELEGNEYYFGDEENPGMKTGFMNLKENKYFFSVVGILKKNAWIKSGSSRYYAGQDGVLYHANASYDLAVARIEGDVYAFDTEGRMLSSRTIYNVDGKWTVARPAEKGEYSIYTLASSGKGESGTFTVK